MPYVSIRLLDGVTRDAKAALVREITETLVRLLGKKPEHVHIVIDEIAPENWGYAGHLSDTLPVGPRRTRIAAPEQVA